DEVGDRSGHFDETAPNFLADRGDVLGHIDNAVQIDGPFSGETAHEIKLDALPAMLEGFSTSFIQVVILDLLADLFAHIVPGNFRCQRQAGPADALHQVWQGTQLVVDAETGQRDIHSQGREYLMHAVN